MMKWEALFLNSDLMVTGSQYWSLFGFIRFYWFLFSLMRSMEILMNPWSRLCNLITAGWLESSRLGWRLWFRSPCSIVLIPPFSIQPNYTVA